MKHFLIIGGGLAGTCTAYHLLQRNCQVTLVDNGENYSSKIAAGQVNPIVFRRMTLSWRVEELLPYARSFYDQIQNFTDQKILVEKTIRRMFSHEQEKEFWLKKQELPEFHAYLSKLTEADLNFDKAKNICGSGRVKQSFYVLSIPFLNSIKRYISTHPLGQWLEENFEFSDVNPSKRQWKGTSYDGVIFCTGYLNLDNPYFSFLQVDQTKGEILNIKATIFDEESLNRKCFVLPLEKGEYRIGSNYEWNTPDLRPTQKARTDILNNLKSLVDTEVEVTDHQAGIRPTTKDRRPILGKHPEVEGFYLFNGLGAKGYMSGPLLSKEFTEYILDGTPLHEEVDLRRYD